MARGSGDGEGDLLVGTADLVDDPLGEGDGVVSPTGMAVDDGNGEHISRKYARFLQIREAASEREFGREKVDWSRSSDQGWLLARDRRTESERREMKRRKAGVAIGAAPLFWRLEIGSVGGVGAEAIIAASASGRGGCCPGRRRCGGVGSALLIHAPWCSSRALDLVVEEGYNDRGEQKSRGRSIGLGRTVKPG